MSIGIEEVVDLANSFHDCVMKEKGDGAAQARYFLHRDPLIYIPHVGELSLQANYEVHQRLTDEKHIWQHDRELTQLSNEPERARAIFAVYWEGRIVETGGIVKAIVGEDWILQRKEDGALKIALYINSYHHLLPDSASLPLD